MAFTAPDSGPYLVTLGMKNAAYTIKDAWAREEIAKIEEAIEGGTHFRGVLTSGISGNTIADNEAVKNLYVGASPGTLVPAANQKDGDLFIYNNGTQNLEFIVANGRYSELGGTGTLGAFAYADTGTFSVTIPIQQAIVFNDYTPQVTKGTLDVSTSSSTINISTTPATASGTFSPASITVPSRAVTLTPTTGTFSALTTVSYDSATSTLTISESTSDAFWKGATGSTAAVEVAQTPAQAIAVTYDKVVEGTATVISAVELTGDLSVSASKPTATITNPTVTATVTPSA